MAWVTITNNPTWEYDNNPPDPGGALSTLWSTGTNGIRTSPSGDQIYMNCRMVGTTSESVPSEINKTFWDAQS